jgi:hypothetical protein
MEGLGQVASELRVEKSAVVETDLQVLHWLHLDHAEKLNRHRVIAKDDIPGAFGVKVTIRRSEDSEMLQLRGVADDCLQEMTDASGGLRLGVVCSEVDADVDEVLHVVRVDRETPKHAWFAFCSSAENDLVLGVHDGHSFIVVLPAGQENLPMHLGFFVEFVLVEGPKLLGASEDCLTRNQELIKD